MSRSKRQEDKRCFACLDIANREVEKLFMVALDKPYLNLWFHKACLDVVLEETGGWEGLEGFIISNIDPYLI